MASTPTRRALLAAGATLLAGPATTGRGRSAAPANASGRTGEVDSDGSTVDGPAWVERYDPSAASGEDGSGAGEGGDGSFRGCVVADDGYVCVGVAGRYATYRGWVVGTDAAGREQWSRTVEPAPSADGAADGRDGRYSYLSGVASVGSALVAVGGTAVRTPDPDRVDRGSGLVVTLARSGSVARRTTVTLDRATGFSAVVPLASGFAAVGYTSGTREDVRDDALVVRYDADGEERWRRPVGARGAASAAGADTGSDADLTVRAEAAVPRPNGGVLIAGSAGQLGRAERPWLAALDADGSVAWADRWTDTQGARVESVVRTPGGYALAGQRAFGHDTQGRGWLVGLDRSGGRRWERTFGDGSWFWTNDLLRCDDGGFVVVGTREARDEGPRGIWLVRTDNRGRVEWNRTQYAEQRGGGPLGGVVDGLRGGEPYTPWREGAAVVPGVDGGVTVAGEVDGDEEGGRGILLNVGGPGHTDAYTDGGVGPAIGLGAVGLAAAVAVRWLRGSKDGGESEG
ncbi:hypothetical protein ACFO0N_09715 [Halobium salinum]|uniref:Uncharacterized protein n=1 Tax=Halobium salinum TaxID=1364940 RepID=A0ABD5PBW3_9EURY|nr:hypothetical protein [Halobium salinum]